MLTTLTVGLVSLSLELVLSFARRYESSFADSVLNSEATSTPSSNGTLTISRVWTGTTRERRSVRVFYLGYVVEAGFYLTLHWTQLSSRFREMGKRGRREWMGRTALV